MAASFGLEQTPNPRLCNLCQPWDQPDVFTFEPHQSRRVLEVSRNVDCLMCRNVILALSSRPQDLNAVFPDWQHCPQACVVISGPFHFSPNGTRLASKNRPPGLADGDEEGKGVVTNVLIQLRISFEDIDRPEDLIARLSLSLGVTPQFSMQYRLDHGLTPRLVDMQPWETPFADLGMMRKWIEDCEQSHGAQCIVPAEHSLSAMLPNGAKLIDLKSLAIVDAPSNARFVALSYMWPTGDQDHDARLERANLALLSSPDSGLNSVPLPPNISSAISLSKGLGENYLWIDRFCIVQDDIASKQVQIDAMARIYEAAAFTIVAALNSRDGRSLPGVDRPRESHWVWPPHDVEIEGASVKPEVMASVQGSLWNMRGWTFQESKLSARKLFITERHVAFQCSQGVAYEEHSQYNCNETPEPEPSGDVSPQDLTLYLEWAGDYASRELSYGGDILNAFAGVSDRMSRILGCRFLFNMPEKYLAQVLRWNAVGPVRTRHEAPSVPSWSWASCKNGIDFGWPERSAPPRSSLQISGLESIVSLVRFYAVNASCSLQDVQSEERWLWEKMTLEKFRYRETVPRTDNKLHPPHPVSHQIWSLFCPHNPWTALESLALDEEVCRRAVSFPGALVFNTTTARLSIRDDGDGEGPGIFGPTGHLAGRLPGLDRNIYEFGGDRLFEFVVICGGLENARSRRSLHKLRAMATTVEQSAALQWNIFCSWRLFVLLVQRDTDKQYLVRRLHAGYIYAARWKMCQPCWETIILV